MSGPRPRIVVTLPARTVAEAKAQLATARDAGADAAELRLDRFAAAELDGLDRLEPAPLELVATYRSRAEGGEGADAGATREGILTRVARPPFRWIDLEVARDRALVSRLPPPSALGRIFSCHLDGGESEAWLARLRELESAEGIGKLVVRARVGTALGSLLEGAERVGGNLVILTTGPSGALFRAWSRRLGYPLVYASLPEREGLPPVEPSQIPVDRLRPYLDADEPGPLFAVCGRPVGHSRSPAIHAAWMRAEDRAGLYVPLEFGDDREFLDALEPLAARGFRGLNVTHPFKQVAAEAATESGAGAVACGVANCLTFRDGGVVAENTDLLAVLRRLGELRAAGRWDGQAMTVLGAGGAARATLAAARELGTRATIYARRPREAERMAREFGAHLGEGAPSGPASLVVHATNVGRTGAASLELPLTALLGPRTHVLDWVYDPEDPAIRSAATGAGATYEDGWSLLVYQAAASYEIWWGEAPPSAEVERTLAGGRCAA